MKKSVICGIYMIRNKKNNKVYIGSSNDIARRWRHHRSCLKRGTHVNAHLQRSYNKHGKAAFEYIVLKEVVQNALLEEEKKFLILLDAVVPSGYNISNEPIAPFTGKKHTKRARKNQSTKNSGQQNYWYGKKLEEEHNRKISKSNKRYTDTEEKNFYLRYENGETLQEIANEQKVHPTTIRRAIDRYERFKEYYEKQENCSEDTPSSSRTR